MRHLKHLNEEVENDEDYIETLLSALKKYIKAAGFEPFVTYDEGDIYVQFILAKSETMPSFMKVMNLCNRLSADIFAGYHSEFDMVSTSKGQPMITLLFYSLSGKNKKDDYPFDTKGKKDDDDDESYTGFFGKNSF